MTASKCACVMGDAVVAAMANRKLPEATTTWTG
jgi:hypothetical protein